MLEQIKSRQAVEKAEYSTPLLHPQHTRDIDYLLGLIESGTLPLISPVVETSHPSARNLDDLPEGSRVLDATGDTWFKLPDGRWSFKNVTTS